jgi:hypothetical protein
MTLSGRSYSPGDQVRNDRVAIRIGGVRLHKGVSVLAKVAEHKMKVIMTQGGTRGGDMGALQHYELIASLRRTVGRADR